MNWLFKKMVILIIAIVCTQLATAQTNNTPKIEQYWLVILKTGPQDSAIKDTAQRNKIFAGHFGNMTRLYNDGILKLNVAKREEAKFQSREIAVK